MILENFEDDVYGQLVVIHGNDIRDRWRIAREISMVWSSYRAFQDSREGADVSKAASCIN